jgi:hypothetical protein
MLLQKSEPQRAAKQQRLLRSSSAKAGKDRPSTKMRQIIDLIPSLLIPVLCI